MKGMRKQHTYRPVHLSRQVYLRAFLLYTMKVQKRVKRSVSEGDEFVNFYGS